MTVDYSSRMRCAEEVVAGVIDDLLTEGGHMLWQKYLQRKAFPFATEVTTDVLVSHACMSFVPHDKGELDISMDDESWSLEPEPILAEVDSWARMQLTVRRNLKKKVNDMSPAPRREQSQRFTTQRTRISDARSRPRTNTGPGRDKLLEVKSFDVREESQMDLEEERLRDARQLEDARRRDQETRVRQKEKSQEAEQQKVSSLHEEMARRQHTFDSEGGLIWVEELKMDRLPKVQEVPPYFVKRDPRAQGAFDDKMQGKESTIAKGKNKQQRGPGKRRNDKSSKGKLDEEDFPDGYSKLQHGQPPILETMSVMPGVVLDVYGKSKSGPALAAAATGGGGMSRKEYVAISEKEMAHEAQFSSSPDPEHGGRPPSTADSRSLTATGGLGATQDLAGEGGDSLPAIGSRGLGASTKGRGGASSSTSKPGEEGTKPKAEVKMAPQAPAMSVRSKKLKAIGHLGQPPRLHVAPLGGPHGFGVAQPPLGATMGHGLVRHGSMNDSYFFPRTGPEIPSLLRATSDTAFGPKGQVSRSPRWDQLAALPLSGRGGSQSQPDLRTQTAPTRLMEMERAAAMEEDDQESPRHGRITVDKKSQAYRGMRQTLFPNTLNSGYVAGMK